MCSARSPARRLRRVALFVVALAVAGCDAGSGAGADAGRDANILDADWDALSACTAADELAATSSVQDAVRTVDACFSGGVVHIADAPLEAWFAVGGDFVPSTATSLGLCQWDSARSAVVAGSEARALAAASTNVPRCMPRDVSVPGGAADDFARLVDVFAACPDDLGPTDSGVVRFAADGTIGELSVTDATAPCLRAALATERFPCLAGLAICWSFIPVGL